MGRDQARSNGAGSIQWLKTIINSTMQREYVTSCVSNFYTLLILRHEETSLGSECRDRSDRVIEEIEDMIPPQPDWKRGRITGKEAASTATDNSIMAHTANSLSISIQVSTGRPEIWKSYAMVF